MVALDTRGVVGPEDPRVTVEKKASKEGQAELEGEVVEGEVENLGAREVLD